MSLDSMSSAPCEKCHICHQGPSSLYHFSSQPLEDNSPFFPFLLNLTRKNPKETAGGGCSTLNFKVCSNCAHSLIHQYNEFEKKKLPHNKRIYVVNGQAYGPPAEPVYERSPDNGAALDLSLSNKASPSDHRTTRSCFESYGKDAVSWTPMVANVEANGPAVGRSYSLGPNAGPKYPALPMVTHILPNSTSALIISNSSSTPLLMPNAVPSRGCLMQSSMSSHGGFKPLSSSISHASEVNNGGPSLSGKKSPDSRSSSPPRIMTERNYILRRPSGDGLLLGESKVPPGLKSVSCIICEIDLPCNIQLRAISVVEAPSDSSSETRLLLSTAQEVVLSPDTVLDIDRVLVCVVCFKKLVNYQQKQQECEPRSVLRKKLSEFNEVRQCLFCRRFPEEDKGVVVHTNPTQAAQCGGICQPFLRDLVKPQEISDSSGRVYLCTFCHMSFQNQWESFEKAHIPHNQREYHVILPKDAITAPKSPDASSNSPTKSLHIQVSSPPLYSHSQLNSEPLLTTVATPTVNVFVTSSSKCESKTNDERPKVFGQIDSLSSILGRPLADCVSCQICHNVDVTYKIGLIKNEREPDLPYFPYLQRPAQSPDDAGGSIISANELLVCTFCYHSLIAQWVAYETSPNLEDTDPNRRVYNTVNYVCYICGVTTYRTRIKSITVKDFPFLVDHPRPAGALSINNGESVITCLTCFDTLTSQWRDFERMKVPLEMRKYNWIALPMPPERSAKSRSPDAVEVSNVSSDVNVQAQQPANSGGASCPRSDSPPPSLGFLEYKRIVSCFLKIMVKPARS